MTVRIESGAIEKLVQILRAGYYFAGTCFLIALGGLVWNVRAPAAALLRDTDATMQETHAGIVAAKPKISVAYEQIFDPKKGAAENVVLLVRTVREGVDTIRKMEIRERQSFDTQLALANGTATKLNGMLDDGDAVIKMLKDKVPGFTAQLSRLGDDFHINLLASHEMLEAVIADLDDPDIKKSLGNVAELTAALKEIAAHGDRVMVDVEKVADHYEIKLDSPMTRGQKFIVGAKVAAAIIGNLFKASLP
jgi:hypothetical protein